MAPRLVDIAEVIEANRAIGHHWFDPDNVRHARARWAKTAWELPDGTRYFVASRRLYDFEYPRIYEVMCQTPDGAIAHARHNTTTGHESRADAQRALSALVF